MPYEKPALSRGDGDYRKGARETDSKNGSNVRTSPRSSRPDRLEMAADGIVKRLHRRKSPLRFRINSGRQDGSQLRIELLIGPHGGQRIAVPGPSKAREQRVQHGAQ